MSVPKIINKTIKTENCKNEKMAKHNAIREISNCLLNLSKESTSIKLYETLPKEKDSRNLNEKRKSSFSTVSTNYSDSNMSKKTTKINFQSKILIAQNKWKENFCASFIQKVFRGHIFRKLYRNKHTMIYRKKKIQSEFKPRLSVKNKADGFQKSKIKTIVIESFYRPKLITNYPKNVVLTTEI